jgi:uncharacterized damage-inducible protein DinB
MANFFVSVLEEEFKTNVRVFKAVPEERRDYRPDSVSKSALEIVRHLACEDPWFLDAVIDGRFGEMPDQSDASGITSVAKAIELYNTKMPARIEKVKSLSGEQLSKEVDLLGVFKFPAAVFLSFAIRHTVHHRGQLSAYLRAMGSKVPQIYGGSADEPMEIPAKA